MPKARPALHRGRAGAGDAVYFPAHRPARTRPARWPGSGPLRGGPEMPPTGAARTRCGFCHLPARYDGGPQMRITQVIRNFSTVSRLGRSPAQIAYNPPSVMRAGQEPAAIAAHQEQRAKMPFTGAALVRGPCLISGFAAAVCVVRRHRRQDEASAACLALPLPFRECSHRPVFFACGECRQVITPDLQPPQGGGEKEGGASCRNGVRKKAGRTAAYGWRARVERAGTGRRRWPPSEARISGREWRAILPGKGVKS